jgi:hypothetical protein
MCKTEVTWEVFVKYFENRKASKVDGVTRPSPPYEPPHGKMGVGSHPAVSMRWHGAMGYCEWVSTLTGRRFRLPTEAEWEYAARAGSTAAGPANPDETAWYAANGEKKTHLTGTRKPNAFGIQDLMGNVWEYALEPHSGASYAPILRGGGWHTPAAELRFAARQSILPEWYDRDPNRPRSMWWLTDGAFVCEARRAARALAAHGAPVYLYELTHTLESPRFHALGATHNVDLWLLFGNEEAGIVLAPSELPLSHTIMDAWGRFARTGDPNGPRLFWPRYTAEKDELLLLDSAPAVAPTSKQEICAFWDRFERRIQ